LALIPDVLPRPPTVTSRHTDFAGTVIENLDGGFDHSYFPVDAGPFAFENDRPEAEPAEAEEHG